METYRKKQIQKNGFSYTSGGCVISVSNNSLKMTVNSTLQCLPNNYLKDLKLLQTRRRLCQSNLATNVLQARQNRGSGGYLITRIGNPNFLGLIEAQFSLNDLLSKVPYCCRSYQREVIRLIFHHNSNLLKLSFMVLFICNKHVIKLRMNI